jgi:hypothetical protein
MAELVGSPTKESRDPDVSRRTASILFRFTGGLFTRYRIDSTASYPSYSFSTSTERDGYDLPILYGSPVLGCRRILPPLRGVHQFTVV